MKRIIIAALTAAAALTAWAGAVDVTAERAAAFLKSVEGFSPTVYYDNGGTAAIGYGFTERALLAQKSMGEAEASKVLLRRCHGILLRLRCELCGGNRLEEREEVALVSFVYNVGWAAFRRSRLYILLKSGRRGAVVAAEFRRWIFVTKNGRKVASVGLLRRRERERGQFLGIGQMVMVADIRRPRRRG